jgi:hypothetical protein
VTSLALAAAVVTVACLDIIIAIGAGIPESSAGEQVIAVAVPVMDIALVLSSALMLRMCVAIRSRAMGALFALNLILFAAAVLLRLTDVVMPRWLLFSFDVYWLNLYLFVLSRLWPHVNRAALRAPALRSRWSASP